MLCGDVPCSCNSGRRVTKAQPTVEGQHNVTSERLDTVVGPSAAQVSMTKAAAKVKAELFDRQYLRPKAPRVRRGVNVEQVMLASALRAWHLSCTKRV